MAEPHRVTESPRQAPKQPRRIPGIILVFAFVFVAGVGFFAGMVNSQLMTYGSLKGMFSRNNADFSSLNETYRALVANFDGNIDKAKLVEGANKGMVNALGDQYTVFMNAAESNSFNDSLTGNIGGGVGIELGMRNSVPTVLRLLKDNPAEKAGVLVGDVITAVNDESVDGKSINDIVTKIRGEADTSVKITVLRSGESKTFAITRQVVNNPSAYGTVQDGVGLLTITRFDSNTGDLARQIATDFKNQNVKGVVLDLRGNGGGFVSSAQQVAGIWLNNQVVVSERANGKTVDELKTANNALLDGMPTVVLVNESSASASEIVAGALRDHKAAKLIGTTTFGKGSVQKVLSLSDGATLKVTVARWYTPAGVNISQTGIKPDVTVERTATDINAGQDPQLKAALDTF